MSVLTVRTPAGDNGQKGTVSTMWRAQVCDRESYDKIEHEIASAIHNNHSAPPGYAPPCFLCRRDARAVLHRLHDMGFSVRVATAALLAAAAAPKADRL